MTEEENVTVNVSIKKTGDTVHVRHLILFHNQKRIVEHTVKDLMMPQEEGDKVFLVIDTSKENVLS